MAAKAIAMLLVRADLAGTAMFSATMSGPPSEQPRRADQQHDCHDDKDHRIRGLRKEHLSQPLDNAETESGYDGAEDRTHAADYHNGEHHDDQLGTHLRTDVVDRRR